MSKKIGLALGSGGARGLCEIGILLWLKENDIKISSIAGTSMGSLIGAATAAGYSPEHLKDIALKTNWKDFLKFVRLSFTVRSIFDWDKIGSTLREEFGKKRIEDLQIPFACVAADIDSGVEFVFRDGDIVDAISASACIPGVFPPVRVMGRNLVDGEIVNPVPLDIAHELGAERIIGVNACRSVFSERSPYESRHIPVVERLDEWLRENMKKAPIISSIGGIRKVSGEEKKKRRSRNLVDVFTDSMAIVTSRLLSFERLNAGPHFMIRPKVGGFQDFDFDRAEEIIDAGYREISSVGAELLDFIES
ncbi:MAG: patatin-like phospholipase family protein [Candidatus Krumholzibacteriota bacterium]|nr:patatin-like phospholipase family protein [Candidatus Krumholzibacteriota bacterium]